MKIKITGINGYLGQLLSNAFQTRTYHVSGINRKLLYGPIEKLSDEIKGCDVIINLAGASILRPWTKKNKKLIYKSRIETSKNLVKAINNLEAANRPKQFISASAIGLYKSGFKHDDSSLNFDSGFVGTVVKDWEETTTGLPKGVQKNIFRIGLVLGKNAKTITNLLTPFKLGLGGKIGSGKQAFPFIHEKDLVRAFVWAVENVQESKTFNLVAPQNITNLIFTKTFAKSVNRPAFFPVPKFLLKIVLGESASLLLESPQVTPKALLEAGFEFDYPTIEKALVDILA